MGRSALDEDAIRLIEQNNPDLEFDWTRILKGQGAPGSDTRPPQDADFRRRPQRFREFPSAPAAAPPPPPEVPEIPRDAPPDEAPGQAPDKVEVSIDVEVVAVEPVRVTLDPVMVSQDPVLFVVADASEAPAGVDMVEADQPMTAARARLGSEGLSRLRARHAEVLARISEKTTDAARRDQLKTEAERLNPDTWVTEAEVVAGLEQYETVFESLRSVVGRRRKRRRRRGAGPAANGQPAGSPADGDFREDDGPSSGEEV